ncbi:hypothetical protein F2Q69_00029556 [Brassica cretica]|uniref:Uncharacterized protein n=1 Tax=Brassica cretica TaxID=69181 RepID=A0A8S9S1L9_BRACR|nr:hypothetical protein F2Q69_00029556 [Brassica cretica]
MSPHAVSDPFGDAFQWLEMSKNLMTDSSARGKQRGSGGYDGCEKKSRTRR